MKHSNVFIQYGGMFAYGHVDRGYISRHGSVSYQMYLTTTTESIEVASLFIVMVTSMGIKIALLISAWSLLIYLTDRYTIILYSS